MAGKKNLHPDEEIVDMLYARFEQDLADLIEWSKTDGRPIFTTTLSPEQQFTQFMNPQTRDAIMTRLAMQDGPAAVRKYVEHMVKLAPKVEERRQKVLRGEEV